jgi:hypothetical protein
MAFSPEVHFYVFGCGGIKSAQHLFLSCSTFGSLWALVVLRLVFRQLMPTFFLTTLFSSLIRLRATSTTVLFAAHLASLRLGRVERKKPSLVQKCSKSGASSVV